MDTSVGTYKSPGESHEPMMKKETKRIRYVKSAFLRTKIEELKKLRADTTAGKAGPGAV